MCKLRARSLISNNTYLFEESEEHRYEIINKWWVDKSGFTQKHETLLVLPTL